MGVQAAVSGDVVEPDNTTIFDVVRTDIVPRLGARKVGASVAFRHNRQSLVLHDPDVVLVLVGIQGDLLLLATSWVHVAVGVQVATLCIPVTERDTASIRNISRDILHTFRVQRSLELRGHETITIAGIDQADEVDTEHGHIERDGDDNQAEQTGEEVLEPQSRSNGPSISKQHPELQKRQAANPCNGEESNPLYASCSPQTKTGRCKPEPPCRLESLRWTLFVLVCKAGPGECSERGKDDQR